MSLIDAIKHLNTLITHSEGEMKSKYCSLMEILQNKQYEKLTSKQIESITKLKTSIIRNISSIANDKDGKALKYIKVYTSKHGVTSLINLQKTSQFLKSRISENHVSPKSQGNTVTLNIRKRGNRDA